MRSYLIALGLLALASSGYGQKTPKTFDNFDRAQGVQVYMPPAPPLVEKKKVKTRKGTKWVVAVDNKLLRKTAQSGPVARVTDGYATRTAAPMNSIKLAMGTAAGLKGFTTGSSSHDSYIVDSSRRYGIDPLLIYAQMHQESSFKIRATSHKGASGLMQLMPATARRFGVTKIYDPQQNIDAGVKYMRWLLDHFGGDVVLALAGYNAGEGAVMKYGWRIPPYRETQEYVRRITGRYNSISDPKYVQTARHNINTVASKLDQNASRPLSVYEPTPLTLRTSDGKMILINQ